MHLQEQPGDGERAPWKRWETKDVSHFRGILHFMSPKEISHRQRQCGKFIVDGSPYEGPEGETFWRVVVTSPTSGHPDDERTNLECLIRGDEFRCFEVGIALPDFDVVTGRAVPNLDASIRAAITEAVRFWENERAERAVR